MRERWIILSECPKQASNNLQPFDAFCVSKTDKGNMRKKKTQVNSGNKTQKLLKIEDNDVLSSLKFQLSVVHNILKHLFLLKVIKKEYKSEKEQVGKA